MGGDLNTAAQAFEAAMLVAFGFAWPVDIVRTLRTRTVAGKSVLFMGLILAGYVAGMIGKLLRAVQTGGWPEAVTVMYLVNAAMLTFDIALYYRFRGPRP